MANRQTVIGLAVAGTVVLGLVAAQAFSQGVSVRGERVTFAKHVAPILFERCGGCHQPGGAGPFSLLSYSSARRRAAQIASVTKSRVMPPWKSEPGYGEFVG